VLTDFLKDLILPRTDAMVAAQAVILVILVGLGVWHTWHIPELRLLVLGLGVFIFGLMVLRAAH
jgi:hypothetical protein